MRIKELSIKQFKGISSLSIALNGMNAEVRGANGTGKTSIADAINWCLFGKSSDELADFGIRPVVGDKENDTEVKIITTDDTIICRKLHEKWQKPKGKSEVIYKGTETICEWNELPITATEYKKRVADLFPVGDDIFKLCTRPDAFTSLKWQTQKEILLDIVGTPTADEIGMDDFLKELNGKSLDEFKAIIAKKKKAVKELIETIPARIDEASKLKKTATDEDRQELSNVTDELDMLRNAGSNMNAYKEKSNEIRKQIADLNAKKQSIISAFNQQKAVLDGKILSIQSEMQSLKTNTANSENMLNSMNALLLSKRAEYETEYNKKFENDGFCPVCHQPYPAEMFDDMLSKFNTEKAEKLARLAEDGKKVAENAKNIENDINSAKLAYTDKSSELGGVKADLDALQTPQTTTIDEQIKALMQKEADLIKSFGDIDNSQRISELEREKSRLSLLVNVDDFNAGIDARIEDLRKQLATNSNELAKLEQSEYNAKEYSRKMIELAENKINAKFNKVRFKFSKPTLEDGGYIETCIATINNVEFKDLNTASKVNAGIEIINVLSEHYKVDAPLIIDNRERVTKIEECNQQTISLVVDPKYTELHTEILK